MGDTPEYSRSQQDINIATLITQFANVTKSLDNVTTTLQSHNAILENIRRDMLAQHYEIERSQEKITRVDTDLRELIAALAVRMTAAEQRIAGKFSTHWLLAVGDFTNRFVPWIVALGATAKLFHWIP